MVYWNNNASTAHMGGRPRLSVKSGVVEEKATLHATAGLIKRCRSMGILN